MTTSFKGPITYGADVNRRNYEYRTGTGMFSTAEYITYFNDFLDVETSNALLGLQTITDAGLTLVNSGEHGGGVTMSSDGTTEGLVFYLPKCIQLGGKKFFMEVRVKTADADDTDVQFGLTDLSATTNPEDLWDTSNADGIAAGVLDGSALFKLVYDKDNAGPTTETSTASLADDTFTTLAISYNGASDPSNGSVKMYADGIEVASADTNAKIPEDVLLAPFFGARTGGDASHTITFDYFRFTVER